MKKRGGINKRASVLLAVFVILLGIGVSLLLVKPKTILYGTTFSTIHARELGFDPVTLFQQMLTDFSFSTVRIPVYWNDIETSEHVRDYAELDKLMDLAAQHGAAVTMAIGEKVPRWPECFTPAWAQDSPTKDEALFSFMQETVDRYKTHPALERWQVENESYFPFGTCPSPDPQRERVEVQLVRKLDPDHPIVRTTSGEQSVWVVEAIPADVLGYSLYRIVENPVIGRFRFPHSARLYRVQTLLARLFAQRVIVSELQAEPWLSLQDGVTTADQAALFTGKDLEENVHFARRTGAKEVMFWGVEWWYFLQKNTMPDLFNTARAIVNGESL